jgi:two-component system CheB/CheR fusion protein
MHTADQRQPVELFRDEPGEGRIGAHCTQPAVDDRWMERLQRRQDERFRHALEASSDAVVRFDMSHRICMANLSAARLAGYESVEAMLARGTTAFDFLASEEHERVRENWRKLAEAVLPWHSEYMAIRADGSRFPIESNISVLRGLDGAMIGVVCVIRDITDRKRAEQALREGEERFRSVVEASPDAIAVADFDGRILMANRQAALLGGFKTVEEVLARGLNGFDFLAPEETQRATSDIGNLIDANVVRNVEYIIVRSDGTRIPVEINVAVLKNTVGDPINMICVIRDVSARKRAEEDLRETQRQAVAANRAKTQFLTNMSHEIRTPMTSILGFADLLMDADLPREKQIAYLKAIRRNGKALLELINEILDLSKIEAGKMSVESVDCSIRQLIADVLAAVRVSAQEKALTLDVTYDGSVPRIIGTDPTKLRQILVNLVGNAVKFTERGGVRISVCGEPARQNVSRIRFIVSDSGIGIAPQMLAGLFQPFTQADASTTRRFGGTGLGLAISKRLAKLLGGDIEVRSEPGLGSEFTLTLEVDAVAGMELAASDPASSAEQAGNIPTGGCRVLLAEDAPDIQLLLGQVFRGMNLAVDIAENGHVACQKAMQSCEEGKPYHLILMDVQMPGRDGLEATRCLRERGWKGPIVALTAHAMSGDREKCLQAGCNDYVAKTTPLVELRAAVARHLPRAA